MSDDPPVYSAADEDDLEARLAQSLLDQLVNGKPNPIEELIARKMAEMEASIAKYFTKNLWKGDDDGGLHP